MKDNGVVAKSSTALSGELIAYSGFSTDKSNWFWMGGVYCTYHCFPSCVFTLARAVARSYLPCVYLIYTDAISVCWHLKTKWYNTYVYTELFLAASLYTWCANTHGLLWTTEWSIIFLVKIQLHVTMSNISGILTMDHVGWFPVRIWHNCSDAFLCNSLST